MALTDNSKMVLAVNGHGVLAGQQVDDLERLLDDRKGLSLLTGVAAVEHEGSSQTLDSRAQGLLELLSLVPRVRTM
jgi:hypothetical protein